ncbi:MAG: hypothetical protein ACFE8M_05715 [Candidatus Hermodarchaeota archaeon]
MVEIKVWDPSERLLWGIAIVFLIICGIFYIYRGKQKEKFNDKIVLFGFGGFIFGLAINRIFHYLCDLAVPGTYVNNIFYGDYNNIGSTWELFARFGVVAWVAGISFLIFAYESIIRKTKFALLIIQIISIIFLFFSPYNLMSLFYSVFIIYDLFLLMLIMFYFTKWSRLNFKAISSLLLFGFILNSIAWDLSSRAIKELNLVPLSLSPIIFILGTFIAFSPMIVHQKYFSRALYFWIILGISTLSLLIALEIFYIFMDLSVYNILYTLALIIIIIPFLYFTIYNIKTENLITVNEEPQTSLRIFSKPQRITEEEVTFFREQRICLVCKNKVSRINYICPKCSALYCLKCSEELSNLENMCWVCNEPLDESKPTKPFKEELKKEYKKIVPKTNPPS